MENNKDREFVQAPADEAAESGLENQVVEAVDGVQPLNELEARRAELAETERALQEAQAEVESGKERVSRASKDIAEARKTLAAQKRQVREAEWRAKKQSRQESLMKSKEDLQQELERRKARLQHTKAQMSDKLRHMLSDEMEAMKKRQKTRGAEILAIFAKHNFYANGFTPVELLPLCCP